MCCHINQVFHFLISACSLLLLLFCFLVRFRRYFACTLSYMGSDTAMYEVSMFLLYPAYEGVACFVLRNLMDVNINTIILRLHPTRGSPNNVCLVANTSYNCATRYDSRSEFGMSARERPSGKKRQVLYNFGSMGSTRGSRELPSGTQL